MSSRLLHPTCYKFRHYRGDGTLLWASTVGDVSDLGIVKGSALHREVVGDQRWIDNTLFDEGEQNILNTYFRATGTPTNFYFRLYDDTPVEADGLGDLQNEVSGTSYDGILVNRNTTDWGSPTTDGGGYKVTSVTKTFTAGGTWSDASVLVLATAQNGTSGLAIAWAELSQTRTLGTDDSLQVDMAVKLDGVSS